MEFGRKSRVASIPVFQSRGLRSGLKFRGRNRLYEAIYKCRLCNEQFVIAATNNIHIANFSIADFAGFRRERHDFLDKRKP